MNKLLELGRAWFNAWKGQASKSPTSQQINKLMAGITELTIAINDHNAAVTSLATAIDNAVAKGIGGTAPDLQGAVDAINSNTTALNTAKDKLLAATPA